MQEIIDAFMARDVDGLVDRLTEDVFLQPSAFISGRSVYDGRQAVRDGFDELERELSARGERVELRRFRHYVDRANPDVVLSLGHVTIIRASGDQFGTEIAYLSTFAGDQVAHMRAWLEHGKGLAQLEEPVEVEV